MSAVCATTAPDDFSRAALLGFAWLRPLPGALAASVAGVAHGIMR
jgi:hypothetical protein